MLILFDGKKCPWTKKNLFQKNPFMKAFKGCNTAMLTKEKPKKTKHVHDARHVWPNIPKSTFYVDSREDSWSVVISNNSLKEKCWDKVDKRPIILLSAGNTCVSILRSRSSERGRKELGHLPIFPQRDAPLASWSSLFSFLFNPIGANVPPSGWEGPFSKLAWLGGIQNWFSYDF